MSIKVLLVDDEKLIRDGLKIILDSYDDIEIVGSACNGMEAYLICGKSFVDIILMDIRMPDFDGVQGTKLIKKEYPSIKIIILTTFSDMEYIQDALHYGASGYLLKDSDYDLIYQSIKTAHVGNVVIHPNVAGKLLNHETIEKHSSKEIQKQYDLSNQDIKIIQAVAEGKSNKEIAEVFYLSEGTIKNSITQILGKLELKNRTQLTIFAYQEKLKT